MRGSIPFHEESGAIFVEPPGFGANGVILRYVSTVGFDSALWSEAFSDAVLAHLEMTEKGASASDLAVFKDRLRSAENRDDYRDRPRINQTSRIVRARIGNGWGSGVCEPLYVAPQADVVVTVDGGEF